MYLLPYFSIFKTSEYKHFSTKIDKFSIAIQDPLVITLTGLPTFCILIKSYILPGFAGDVSINLYQLLSRTLFCFHFWSMLSFCKIYLKGFNPIAEKNFFQVSNQSFQNNYHYHEQQNVILYAVYDMFLMSFCMSFRAILSWLLILFLTLL